MSPELNPALLQSAKEAAAPTLELISNAGRLRGLRDIQGPAILYVSYGACGAKDIHNFDHIRAIAKASNRPVYVISLTPESDALAGSINYFDRSTTPLKSYQSPGIPIFPRNGQEAVHYANQMGIAVNAKNISSHSNRLIFIDANERPMASVPSTQPVERIKGMAPSFFTAPVKAQGARIG